jgi:hypothetical protein
MMHMTRIPSSVYAVYDAYSAYAASEALRPLYAAYAAYVVYVAYSRMVPSLVHLFEIGLSVMTMLQEA